MGRTHSRRPGSRAYGSSQPNIEQAMNAVQNGLSITRAAVQFNVSKGTLFNRMKGKHVQKAGRPRAFTDAEENCFVQHLLTVAEWGFPIDKTDLRYLAKYYLDKMGRNVKMFQDNLPSAEWAWRFIKNHKELTSRMCQNIKLAKAGLTRDVVGKYFTELKKSLGVDSDDPIPPNHIFNYDETNLTDDPGSKQCIFKRGVKYAERVKDSTKSSTSVMFCGSAAGEILPPYVVYKATQLWDKWVEGGPKGTRYNRTKSGWFDSYVFTDWFLSTFLPHIRRFGGERVALIGDNLSSHFTQEVVEAALKHNVAFICLPPNSTHIAQPLDVAFCGPLKMVWRKILDIWKSQQRKQSQTITKEAFPSLLKLLCDEVAGVNAVEASNLISGFRKCGINPYNSEEVLRRIPAIESEDISLVNAIESEDISLVHAIESEDISLVNAIESEDISLVNAIESEDISLVNATVSGTVLEMLQKMRNNPGEKARRKKKKLSVTPGKSISYEEVEEMTKSEEKRASKIKTVTKGKRVKRKIAISDSDSYDSNRMCSTGNQPNMAAPAPLLWFGCSDLVSHDHCYHLVAAVKEEAISDFVVDNQPVSVKEEALSGDSDGGVREPPAGAQLNYEAIKTEVDDELVLKEEIKSEVCGFASTSQWASNLAIKNETIEDSNGYFSRHFPAESSSKDSIDIDTNELVMKVEEIKRESESQSHHQPHEGGDLSNGSDCITMLGPNQTGGGHSRKRTTTGLFKCCLCKEYFHTEGDILSHLLVHKGEHPFACFVCGKIFMQRESRDTHMMLIHEFKCNQCGKCFARKDHLNAHNMVNHKDKRPFVCGICRHRFGRRWNLMAHMRRHTGDLYKCSQCDKGFNYKGNLKTHMRKHTGDFWRCSQCDKCFTRKANLKTHMGMHKGERPFACRVCGKSFSRRDNMKAHRRRHTGDIF